MKPNVSSSAGSLNYAQKETGRIKSRIQDENPAETNWDKFQKLLKEYLGAILELEQGNQNGIHIFAHNGKWLAFDRSARRLTRFFPEEDLTQLTLPADFQKNAPATNPAAAELPGRTVMLTLTEQQTTLLKRTSGYRICTPTYIYIG